MNNEFRASILVVDDIPENIRLLTRMLSRQGYDARVATSGELALQSVRSLPPDLILLDICMPGMDGIEVCTQLQADPATREIPIIFLSAMDDTRKKIQALTAGGVDYVTKPFEAVEVLARVCTHLRLRRLQKELREKNLELEAANAALERLAGTDPLTGLYNRRRFLEHLRQCLSCGMRYGSQCSVIMFDIDYFKRVNDSFGHDIGDQVLQTVTRRAAGALRATDIFARWGGEEFIILAQHSTLDDTLVLAERLRGLISLSAIDKVGTVTASFGVACDEGQDTMDSVIKRADDALYAAKAAGRNCVKSITAHTMDFLRHR